MAEYSKEELLTPVPAPQVKGGKTFNEVMGFQQPYLEKGAALQKGIGKAEGDILRGKQAQEEILAGGESSAQKQFAEAQRGAMQQYEEKKEREPLPAFIPTKDNAQDLAGLFSLVGVIGMLAGRSDAQLAMGAMNGMLEGYQKGRGDLYKKESIEFEKNFKSMLKKHEEFRKEMEDAIKLASTDKEAGLTAAKLAAVKAGSAVINAQIDKGDLVGAFNVMDKSQQAAIKAYDIYQKEKQSDKAIAAANERARLQREQALELAKLKTVTPSDTASDVRNYLGVDFGKGKSADTKNDQVAGAANAMAEAMSLANLVRKNPDVVGRVGQAKSFIDKYVKSLDSTGIETDKTPRPDSQQEQEALLFAKRYAAYLIRYEQALAGTAKGFTVAFMRRFNDLMQSNQFNPEGFDGLMKEQIRELASRTAALSTKITEDNMMRFGIAQTRDADAAETYSRIKGQPAPAPSLPSQQSQSTPRPNLGPAPQAVLDKANEAIRKGAKAEDVKKRLQDAGYEVDFIN